MAARGSRVKRQQEDRTKGFCPAPVDSCGFLSFRLIPPILHVRALRKKILSLFQIVRSFSFFFFQSFDFTQQRFPLFLMFLSPSSFHCLCDSGDSSLFSASRYLLNVFFYG